MGHWVAGWVGGFLLVVDSLLVPLFSWQENDGWLGGGSGSDACMKHRNWEGMST